MNKRLLATPLVAATLLLSTLGCSKKEEAAPDPTPTAGYTIGGRIVKCTATSVQTTTSTGSHLLVVELTTSPQPSSGPEVLTLSFTKPVSDPVKNYLPTVYQLVTTTAAGKSTLVAPANNVATLYSTSSGGISGGFATYAVPSASSYILRRLLHRLASLI